MNPLKHMEAIFGVIVAAALLVAALPEREASAAAREPVATVHAGNLETAMPVVVVKGKRLSAREKRRVALTTGTIAAPARG